MVDFFEQQEFADAAAKVVSHLLHFELDCVAVEAEAGLLEHGEVVGVEEFEVLGDHEEAPELDSVLAVLNLLALRGFPVG